MPSRLRFIFLICLALGVAARSAHGVVLLTENAENGLANVTPHISASYPLIQSDVVAQGSNAFHLAHPVVFMDEWFEINQSIVPQADSKLFFMSRLGQAGSAQLAKVQISTTNGSTWGNVLYNQPGTGGFGEGAFSLKTIDLAPYAGQSLRFRFYYDFTSGSYTPETGPGRGWYIDAIQIADQYQKNQYSIGNPSAEAQLYLEYINRARADAFVEANRLAAETNPDITSAYSFFGVTGPNIVNQFQYYVNLNPPDDTFDQHAQPLSFNAKLNTAAQLHTQDMYNFQFQGHDSSASPPAPLVPNGDTGQRLDAVGYDWQQYAENVYSHADSPREGHAAFDVDWGHDSHAGDFYNPAFNGQGMQNEAGHRINIHNRDLKEVGIGVVKGTSGPVGPQLVTQDFASPGAVTFVTGVVYQDLNANQFYDIGEGRDGVRVDVAGSGYFALSTASGGYSVPVTGDGVYNVSFTGGGFAPFSTMANVLNGANVKVDYRVMPFLYQADFNGDSKVDGGDLAVWKNDFGVTKNGQSFLTWQREFGSGVTALSTSAPVPEPPALFLAALSILVATLNNRRAAVVRLPKP